MLSGVYLGAVGGSPSLALHYICFRVLYGFYPAVPCIIRVLPGPSLCSTRVAKEFSSSSLHYLGSFRVLSGFCLAVSRITQVYLGSDRGFSSRALNFLGLPVRPADVIR